MNKYLKLNISLVLILLVVLNVILYYFKLNTNHIYEIFYFYNLYSVITYAFLFLAVVKVGGPFSIHTISSFFVFLFLYGRSLLYIFEPDYSFFESELLLYENVGYVNMFEALVITNIFIYSINVVYILFGKPDNIKLYINERSIKIEKILFNIILVFGFLYAFKLFLEFKAIINIGYTAIYAGGLQEVNYYSPLIKYSHVFFSSFFSYYLIVNNNKKKFLIIAFIFLVVSFLDSLKGARITLILPIFFIFWYYNCVYKITFNYKIALKGSIVFLLLVLYAIYSSSKRNDLEVELKTNFIKSAVMETGSTLQVVGRYIKNKDQLDTDYPFFLEPILYPYFYISHFSVLTKGQSEEMLQYRNSLNHQFTAFIDKEAYLVGRGVGSSSPAEFYQYGLFPLIILSLVYGFILIFFYSQLSNKILIFLSTTLVLHVFFIARETPFPNFIGVLKGVFVYHLLKSLFSIKIKLVNHVRNSRVNCK
jgi:oligosaccharide repeat unit polymerase